MQNFDPNVVMLDQFVRIALMEVLRALVWCGVAAVLYSRLKK